MRVFGLVRGERSMPTLDEWRRFRWWVRLGYGLASAGVGAAAYVALRWLAG